MAIWTKAVSALDCEVFFWVVPFPGNSQHHRLLTIFVLPDANAICSWLLGSKATFPTDIELRLSAAISGCRYAVPVKEFTVTEVYKKNERNWKMLALTFSSVRDTHKIAH